jgi:hypothetical protein
VESGALALVRETQMLKREAAASEGTDGGSSGLMTPVMRGCVEMPAVGRPYLRLYVPATHSERANSTWATLKPWQMTRT